MHDEKQDEDEQHVEGRLKQQSGHLAGYRCFQINKSVLFFLACSSAKSEEEDGRGVFILSVLDLIPSDFLMLAKTKSDE